MQELISVQEAREIIGREIEPIVRANPSEMVPLRESIARVLATDVISNEDHPPFHNSAMDGYAVANHAERDSHRPFRVVGESRAGSPFEGHVGPGEAVRIATGAMIPEGAEVVLPIELARWSDSREVSFEHILQSGANIRAQGKDVRTGQVVVARGTKIHTGIIPMLAMLGVASPSVSCRPRVAVITSGDEIAPEGVPSLARGMIRDANGPGLTALAEAAGATVTSTSHAYDTPEALASAVRAVRDVQIILISGGVSVGPHDHARRVLLEQGCKLAFWRVRQRPGKPLAFGTMDGTAVFALPGNPVSTTVCFDQYVRPAIHSILGRVPDADRRSRAILDEPITSPESLHHMIRGYTQISEDARLHVRPTGLQDSNLISSIADADCLIHIPEGVGSVDSGRLVEIEWWRARA